MGKIISDKRDVIQADLAKDLLKLAFQEMTKSKVMDKICPIYYFNSSKLWLRNSYPYYSYRNTIIPFFHMVLQPPGPIFRDIVCGTRRKIKWNWFINWLTQLSCLNTIKCLFSSKFIMRDIAIYHIHFKISGVSCNLICSCVLSTKCILLNMNCRT